MRPVVAASLAFATRVTATSVCVTAVCAKVSRGRLDTQPIWSTMGRKSRDKKRSRSPRRTDRPAESHSKSSGSGLVGQRPTSGQSSSGPSVELREVQMEGRLLTLLADRPPYFREFLQKVGAQTCWDVRNLWPNGAAMVQELEQTRGRLNADEAFNLAVVWTLALNQTVDMNHAIVQELVDERTSVSRRGPGITLREAPTTSIPSKTRRIIATGMTIAAPPVVHREEADPHAREEFKKQGKIHAIFEFLLDHLVDLGELGVGWEDLQNAEKLQALKDTIMHGAQRLSVERLGALLATAKRWVKFARERNYGTRAPSPLQVAEFLKCVSSGGPTAAASVYQGIKWFEDSFGCVFHTAHCLVRPHRFHGPNHTGRQALELQPWEMANLLLLARRAQGTKLVLVLFFIQSAISCIRFEHFQRSRLIQTHPKFVEFECSKGKRRKQGSRPAYRWAMPTLDFQGLSVSAALVDFLKYETNPDAGFMWPAVELSPDDLWQLHDTSPMVANRPMSRGRYLELLRGTLAELGVERGEAAVAGYNRLRRFLPTLAHCLSLQPQDLQAIGSWIDVPAGGGPTPTFKPQPAQMSMGLHYAGGKVTRSAQVKQHALDIFMMMFKRQMPHMALTREGLFPPYSWSWEEFHAAIQATAVPAVPVEKEEAPPTGDAPLEILEAEPSILPVAEGGQLRDGDKEDQPAAGRDSSSSSSSSESDGSASASDVSAEGGDLVGVVPPEGAMEHLKWFLQHKRVHIIKSDDEAGRCIPWCRDAPFVQDATKCGEGLQTMRRASVCQRCLGRMPRALYVSMSEHCGWLH